MTLLKSGVVALFFLFFSSGSECSVLHVGAQGTYKTISSAIAVALSGDTIVVDGGLYKESDILIDKSLLLRGMNSPVIDGEGKHQIILVKANGVCIDGFVIRNTGATILEDRAGIRIMSSSDCIVENNRFENTCFGCFLSNSSRCQILNNNLKGSAVNEISSGGGIHLLHCDSCTITGNTIIGHRDGIYFEFVTNSIIRQNISQNNIRYGLHFMFSDNDRYLDNVFEDNASGVAVMYSKHIIMSGNRFQDNWGPVSYGLYLKEISRSIIEHNQFIRNTTGIDMSGTNNTKIAGNNFIDNGWALKMVSDCTDDSVTGNNFENNSFDVAAYGGNGHYTFYENYWDDYSGYDLNHDGIGDIPFQPVSLFSIIVQECPDAIILLKSFIVQILNNAEKLVPAFTPDMQKDKAPLMKPIALMPSKETTPL